MTNVVLRLDELLKFTNAAREAHARVVFDIGTIGALMKERASMGYGWVQVRQTKPMNLKGTRAATTLIAWLAKCECRVDWVDMPAREGDPMIRQYQYAELCIFWDGVFDAITVPAEKWLSDAGRTVEE